jgi:hypothetical protein
VYTAIRKLVDEFRQEHIATSSRLENELSIFRENFALIGSRRNITPPPPPPPRTPWSMLSEKTYVEDTGDGRRIGFASRTIQLSRGVDEEQEVEIELGWEVLEDGTWKNPEISMGYAPIEAPLGFKVSEKGYNFFVGKVKRNEALFKWRTKPYSEPWTLRPYMKVAAISKSVGGSK